MAQPSGEIIARPMVARACGCVCEFQHYAVDKYRAQRLAKFQQTRCPACVAKREEEQRRAASVVPTKAEALALLPLGAQVTLTKQSGSTWVGTLAANGTVVETSGDGPQPLLVALARLWLLAHSASTPPDPKPG